MQSILLLLWFGKQKAGVVNVVAQLVPPCAEPTVWHQLNSVNRVNVFVLHLNEL